MADFSELDSLRSELEKAKYHHHQKLLSYSPFQFGFYFFFGMTLASFLMLLIALLLSALLGVGISSMFGR